MLAPNFNAIAVGFVLRSGGLVLCLPNPSHFPHKVYFPWLLSCIEVMWPFKHTNLISFINVNGALIASPKASARFKNTRGLFPSQLRVMRFFHAVCTQL